MTKPAIDLYACMTPNALKVFFMLGEVDVDFEVLPVNPYAGEQFSETFGRLNPNRKLPVLVDRDGPGGRSHTVFESGAILFYLAEKAGLLLGDTLADRSSVMQWLMLQMSTLGPMFGQAIYFGRIAPAAAEPARARYLTQALRLCDLYDERLAEKPWLADGGFSIADIATFPWLWKHPGMLGIDLSGYRHLSRWIDEVRQRPGFVRVYGRYRDLVEISRAQAAAADPDTVDRLFGRGRWSRTPPR